MFALIIHVNTNNSTYTIAVCALNWMNEVNEILVQTLQNYYKHTNGLYLYLTIYPDEN